MNFALLTQHSMSILIGLNTVLYCGFSVYFARFASTNDLIDLLVATAFIILANFVYLQLIKISSLGMAFVLCSMASMIVISLISWFYFKNEFHLHQLAGLICALIAIGLYNLPTSQAVS